MALPFEMMRQGGPAAADELAKDTEETGTKKPAAPPEKPLLRASQMTPEQLRVWRNFVDASEARYMVGMRQMITALREPPDRQRKRFRQIVEDVSESPIDPVNLYAAILLPICDKVASREPRIRAKHLVVLAAAQVLLYRSRRGAFPAQLRDAILQPPRDPITDGVLQYRRERDGFVIYSRGPDGTFDGGSPGKTVPKEQVAFPYPAEEPSRQRSSPP